MKHATVALIAVAGAAALGAVGAAIALGNRLSEPTVVADPYEEGLRYGKNGASAPAGGGGVHDHAHDAAAVGPRAPPRCDLAKGACAQRVGGATVTLAVSPRPPRAMAELALAVSVAPPEAAGGGAGEVAFTMPGMYMGENRAPLAPAGAGAWRGTGTVVRCRSGHRTWQAELTLPAAQAGAPPLRAAFTFDVAE